MLFRDVSSQDLSYEDGMVSGSQLSHDLALQVYHTFLDEGGLHVLRGQRR